jgi:hypothetical protein
MSYEEKLEQRRFDAESALELFAELIGRVAIQHEMLNSQIRRAAEDAFEAAEWQAGGSILEQDVIERLLYKHSASELRQNFVSVLSSSFKRLTPGLRDSQAFSDWLKELGQMLAAENSLRNHIIHSEYFRDAKTVGVDEISGASLANQRKGRYSIRRFTRDFMLDFLRVQSELIFVVMRLQDDINEGCADLFEQAEIYAPDHESMLRRIERRHEGQATVQWLVVQYLGNEVMGRLREAYKSARLGELNIQYSDGDEVDRSTLGMTPPD